MYNLHVMSHCMCKLLLYGYGLLVLTPCTYMYLCMNCFNYLHCTVRVFCSYISFYFPHVGILPPPQHFNVSSTNTTLVVSWVAPPSLEVSTPPTISHYVLGNNVTNITKTISNPPGCRPSVSCISTLDLSDPSLMIHNGSYGEQNTTILDYNGTIQFTFFAINRAGNGNSTTCIYITPKRELTC